MQPIATHDLGTTGLSPVAVAVFDMLARFSKISVPEPQLAEAIWLRVGCARRDHPDSIIRRVLFCGGFDPALAELERAGLMERWTTTKDTPSSYGYAGPAVSLSPWIADRIGLRVNSKITRWVPPGTKDRTARLRIKENAALLVVCESDLADQDPLAAFEHLVDVRARRPDEIAAWSEEQIRRAEREAGFVRPTKLLGCDGTQWPIGGQHRIVPSNPAGRTLAPEHVHFGRVLPKVRDLPPAGFAGATQQGGATATQQGGGKLPGAAEFVQDRWPYTAVVGSPVPLTLPGTPCPVCHGSPASDEVCTICWGAGCDASYTKDDRKRMAKLADADRKAVATDAVPNAATVTPWVDHQARRLEEEVAAARAARALRAVRKGDGGGGSDKGKRGKVKKRKRKVGKVG